MTTVFIVTEGDYSDYRIRSVFSTRELAEAHISNRQPNGEIEEWAVDCERDAVERTLYMVTIGEDGNVLHKSDTSCFDSVMVNPASGIKSQQKEFNSYHKKWYFAGHSFQSHDHAQKLAVECRQAWLREQTEPKP